MKNDKWDKRFMKIAYDVATWSSCIRAKRQVGAVIVKNNRIVATGYNGAPSGIDSCADRGECLRNKMHIPSGQRQELCYATHGEQNALIQAAKLGISVDGATMYVTHRPCAICTKLIINAGIKRIVYAYDYPDEFSTKLLEQAGVTLHQLALDTAEEQSILTKELVRKIEKKYNEWCDDCDNHGLPVFCNPEEVFRFIEYYIDKESNHE